MPPLHSVIENYLREIPRAKHIIYKQGEKYICKTMCVGHPTSGKASGIPLRFVPTEIKRHFLQQSLTVGGEKFMYAQDLAPNVLLLDNELNKVCDRAVVLSHRGQTEGDSILIIIVFVKTKLNIDALTIVTNVYKDLLSRNVIEVYDINAVPQVAPLKMDFKYSDPDHIVFNRVRLDYLHSGNPYSRQVQESGLYINLNNEEVRRLPIVVQLLISPLSPKLDWILYYTKELQQLYENVFFCVLLKGVDRTNFAAVLNRCTSAARLNFVFEPLNCRVADEVLGRRNYVSQIIDLYPIDSYDSPCQQQPRIIAQDYSVEALHANLIDLVQSSVMVQAKEDFRANPKAAQTNMLQVQQYCQEDKIYRMNLIKQVEFDEVILTDEFQVDLQSFKVCRFMGIDLRIYCNAQQRFTEPEAGQWVAIGFVNPHQSGFDDLLYQLDNFQKMDMPVEASISLVLEGSWSKNVNQLISQHVLLRQFNIILDGQNIFRVAGDLSRCKPPFFFFFGPEFTFLEVSPDINYFEELLMNFNEERNSEQQNMEQRINSDPDPDHQVSGINANSSIKFNYDACIGCNACIPACQFEVLTYSNEKNNPPFVKLVNGDLVGNSKLSRVQLKQSLCNGCGQCISQCAIGEVLVPVERTDEIERLLTSRAVDVVVILDPAAIAALTEGMNGFGYWSYQIIATLRDLGVKKIFDLRWAYDCVTRFEAELLLASQQLVVSSSCPGSNCSIRNQFSDLCQFLGSVKTPAQIMAIAVKQWAKVVGVDVKIVNVTNCVAQKQDLGQADFSMSVYELRKLLLKRGVTMNQEREEQLSQEKDQRGIFDQPFNEISPSSFNYGYQGGQAMAVAQAICESKGERFLILNDQNQKITVDIDERLKSYINLFSFECRGEKYTMGQVAGGKSIQKVVQLLKDKQIHCNYLELMACDGGCANGGGISKKPGNLQKRTEILKLQAKTQPDKSNVWKYSINNQLEYLGMNPEEFLKMFLNKEQPKTADSKK